MAKKNLLWQWIILLSIPSVYLILRDELSKVLIDCCGLFWGIVFFIAVTIAVIGDIVILIVKTWDYLKPIITSIVEIIKRVIDLFKR